MALAPDHQAIVYHNPRHLCCLGDCFQALAAVPGNLLQFECAVVGDTGNAGRAVDSGLGAAAVELCLTLGVTVLDPAALGHAQGLLAGRRGRAHAQQAGVSETHHIAD